MNNGFLSQYFEAVAAKKLSAVEVDPATSHQHEFNGSRELKTVLNKNERTQFPTTFMWIEEQNEALSEEGTVTWYDARERHPTRSEYRLYFHGNAVMSMAKEGDTMFIARKTDSALLIIITSSGSTIESQLYWLFGLSPQSDQGFQLSVIGGHEHELDFASRFILDELGVEIEEPENDRLDNLLENFGRTFPSTAVFSKFARENYPEPVDVIADPDGGLLAYLDWEEKLFRRLERHIVGSRLQLGFDSEGGPDVNGFIDYSLSIQNRRKSRAGYAFEDHLKFIFQQNNLHFSRKIETENKAKPDFLFPDISLYQNTSFPNELLTMLGVKTSCKERWRQILAEAARIPNKHLLTLEPGISENQTSEMIAHSVQLVLPQSLHQTYNLNQQAHLMNIKSFINLVGNRQNITRQLGYMII